MAEEHDAVIVEAFNAGDPASAGRLGKRQSREPGQGEVQVKVTYAGVNPSDVFSLMGVYPGFTTELPGVPGFDGMGVVSKVGPGVTGFTAGQRVTSAGWLGDKGEGSWQQVVVVPQERLVALPDAISDEAGAQFYINPVTVVGLLEASAANGGDWILVSAAGSTLSRMLIAAARAQGIKTIGLVRRPEAVQEVKGSTGCDEVVCTATEKVSERVAAITGGAGAAAAIDSVGGEGSAQLGASVRAGGAVIVYGLMDGLTFTGSGVDCLFRDVVYRGFWLVPWLARMDAGQRKAVFDKTLKLMADGVMAPPIGKVFPLAQFAEAVKESQVVGRLGKVLLKCN